MTRITADQWSDARAHREAGGSFREVAEKIGCDASLIHRRAKTEGWSDGKDIEEVVRRRAAEKVNGVVNSVDPAKRSAAIDAAAEKLAAKSAQHKVEWDAPRKIAYESFKHDDVLKMRMAKCFAETLKIIQEGERRAWGLDCPAAAPATVNVTQPETMRIVLVRPVG